MPTIAAHTRPSGEKLNEDWYIATDDLVIVLDGATIRTETGCVHGLPWYVHQLGVAIMFGAQDRSLPLMDVLASAIERVRLSHADTCDLTHTGTPSAAVGILRRNGPDLEWLVLGDVTVMVESSDGVQVTVDDRVSQCAVDERRECDQHLIGTDAKMEAILAMKEIELASRNVEGGYWIASVYPDAAKHAHTGTANYDDVRRAAVCSDGAMRIYTVGNATKPEHVLRTLKLSGPEKLVDQVRKAEQNDPYGKRVPRNKAVDDATAVLLEVQGTTPPQPHVDEATRRLAIHSVDSRMNSDGLFGAIPTRDGRVL